MDDGPRIGGLMALLLIVGATAGYVTFAAHAWAAAPIMVAALVTLIWLERYARRRGREKRAAHERHTRTAIAHLDFEPETTSRDD
jgi:hypothetical protein